MGKPKNPDNRQSVMVAGELRLLGRQLAIPAAIRGRFTIKRLMNKAAELLDAQKILTSRATGYIERPDNITQLGTLKLLFEHYNHRAEPESPIDVDPVDMFRSPAVLGAAKKLIAQQEKELEKLKGGKSPPPPVTALPIFQ